MISRKRAFILSFILASFCGSVVMAHAEGSRSSFEAIKERRMAEVSKWDPSRRRDAFYACLSDAEDIRDMRECKDAMRLEQFENFGRMKPAPKPGIRTAW